MPDDHLVRLSRQIARCTRSALRVVNQVIELFVNLYRPQSFQRHMHVQSKQIEEKLRPTTEDTKRTTLSKSPLLLSVLVAPLPTVFNEQPLHNWSGFVDNCQEGVKDLFCWTYVATAGAAGYFLAERPFGTRYSTLATPLPHTCCSSCSFVDTLIL